MKRSVRLVGPALLIFAAGMALRIGVAASHGLWVDEVFSLAMATGHSVEHSSEKAEPALGDYVELPEPAPPSTFKAYAQHEHPPVGPDRVLRAVLMSDTSPPLYYLLLHAWTRAFGTDDLDLRLFSVFCAAACFPLLWAIGRQLGGRRAATTAVALYAFSPLSLFYATEGRMYSLLWVFVLAGALLTYRIARRPSPVSLAAWALIAAGGMLTHYFFIFPWCAFIAWIWTYPGRCPRLSLVAAVGLVMILIAPWYSHLAESLAGWRVTQGWLELRPRNFRTSVAMAKLVLTYISPAGVWWGETWLRFRPVLGLTVVIAVLAAFVLGRSRMLVRTRVRLVWLWLLAALLGPLVFDQLRHTYVIAVPRYAISGMPAAYLLIALAMRKVPRPIARALLGLIVVAWSPSYVKMLATETRQHTPFSEVGKFLSAQADPDDLVLVHTIPVAMPALARYLGPESGPERGAGMASWVERLGVRKAPEDLYKLARGRRRIFIVRIHEVGQGSPAEEWLRKNATLVSEHQFSVAAVEIFAPLQGSAFFETPELPSGAETEPAGTEPRVEGLEGRTPTRR